MQAPPVDASSYVSALAEGQPIFVADSPDLYLYLRILASSGRLELSRGGDDKVIITIVANLIVSTIFDKFGRFYRGAAMQLVVNGVTRTIPALATYEFKDGILLIQSLLIAGYQNSKPIWSPTSPMMFVNRKRVKLLGKGTYGEVWQVREPGSSTLEAEKAVAPLDVNFIIETAIGLQTRSPFVSRISDFQLTKEKAYLYSPMADGDLYGLIKNKLIDSREYTVIMYQLLHGLAHLHYRGIRHRDIKPENVLCFNLPPRESGPFLLSRRYVLTDFGLSAINNCSAEAGEYSSLVYTAWYRPPEVILRNVAFYTESADIWALGLTFAEMILGQPLFKVANQPGQNERDFGKTVFLRMLEVIGVNRLRKWPEAREFIDKIDVSKYPVTGIFDDPAAINSPQWQLISMMMETNPEKRLSAKALLKLPIFAPIAGSIELSFFNLLVSDPQYNPLDLLVSDRIPETSCLDKLRLSNPPIVLSTKLPQKAVEKILKYLYKSCSSLPLRCFFLSCRIFRLYTEQAEIYMEDFGPIVYSILNIAVDLTSVTLFELPEKIDIYQAKSKILEICNWDPLWATEYDFYQIFKHNHTENSQKICLNLLIYFTQAILPINPEDLVRRIFAIADHIDRVTSGMERNLPNLDTLSSILLNTLRSGTVFTEQISSAIGYTPAEIEIMLTSNYVARRKTIPQLSPIRP